MLLALSAAGVLFEELRRPVLVLDGLFAAAVALDVWRTPSPSGFEVRRVFPERVGLSREFERRLELVLKQAAGLSVEVYEEFPAAFEVREGSLSHGLSRDPSGGPDRATLDGGGRTAVLRTFVCGRRGEYRFGDLRLFLSSRLGLLQRTTRFRGGQSIAVEPALQNLSQTLRLAASERWRDLGIRLIRRHGGASEFESLREYIHGDDVRRIDWKAFARRGKPMVRQYQLERGQEIFLLIDGGRRMRATSTGGGMRGWTKLDWALDAALELGAVALSKGDRVGAAVFERGLKCFVAPARGALQLKRLSRALFDQQPTSGDSDLSNALRELAVHHRRRATVLVLSDVADPLSIEEQRKALANRSSRHQLIFAALDDPELRAAAEDGGQAAAIRACALDLAEDRRRALRRLSSSGARVLDALPAEAAAPLLAAWLEERRTG